MTFLNTANRCACAKLRRTMQAVAQYYDQHLQPSGLRTTQFTMLITISLNEGISISDLGDKICKDQTTITRNVEILKRNGYIRIAKKESDARKKTISLTEEGKKKLAEVMPLWEKAQTHIEEELGVERLGDFFTTLKALEQIVK